RLRARLPAPSAMLEMTLAHVHRALGETHAAQAALAEALRLRPDLGDSATWLRMAQARTREGSADAALDALARAVAAGPGDGGHRGHIGPPSVENISSTYATSHC